MGGAITSKEQKNDKNSGMSLLRLGKKKRIWFLPFCGKSLLWGGGEGSKMSRCNEPL